LGALMRNTSGDIYGFLIGDVSVRQTRSTIDMEASILSDNVQPALQDFEEDSKHEGNTLHTTKTRVHVSSFKISDKQWFNEKGMVDTTTQLPNNIVGWFTLRQSAPLKLSLKQVSLHYQLSQQFTPIVFALFGIDQTAELHSVRYKFFYAKSQINQTRNIYPPLQPVRVTVQNLKTNTEHYTVQSNTQDNSPSLVHVESMTMTAVQELEQHFNKLVEELYQVGKLVTQKRLK
jgi:hypothetical protein